MCKWHIMLSVFCHELFTYQSACNNVLDRRKRQSIKVLFTTEVIPNLRLSIPTYCYVHLRKLALHSRFAYFWLPSLSLWMDPIPAKRHNFNAVATYDVVNNALRTKLVECSPYERCFQRLNLLRKLPNIGWARRCACSGTGTSWRASF